VATGAEEARLTPLLSNEALGRLEQLRINASRRFTNKSRGEHLSGKGGQTIEFSDYRDYAPGDEIRFVDWNIFARLNRPYMKVFEQEEEMHVVLLVDASESMGFEGKLERARQLAAAFGMMGLLGSERVSAYAFNSSRGPLAMLSPCTGRANLLRVFGFLERIEAGGEAPVEEGIETALKYHAGRGVALVLSDFLTFGDLRRGMNLLFSAGLEIFGLQILSPAEIAPDLSGDARLLDSETGETLDVSSAGRLLELYQEHRADYQKRLARLCRSRFGRFLSVSSAPPIDWLLFDLLPRRGWVQ
jgi:uncharacterized protein (DUF58 family)